MARHSVAKKEEREKKKEKVSIFQTLVDSTKIYKKKVAFAQQGTKKSLARCRMLPA